MTAKDSPGTPFEIQAFFNLMTRQGTFNPSELSNNMLKTILVLFDILSKPSRPYSAQACFMLWPLLIDLQGKFSYTLPRTKEPLSAHPTCTAPARAGEGFLSLLLNTTSETKDAWGSIRECSQIPVSNTCIARSGLRKR